MRNIWERIDFSGSAGIPVRRDLGFLGRQPIRRLSWPRSARCSIYWQRSSIRGARKASSISCACPAVLDPGDHQRLQFVSRHRHLHRRPSPLAEPQLRPEMAPGALAHGDPLHPPGARSGRGGGRVPTPRGTAAGGQDQARHGKTLRGSFDRPASSALGFYLFLASHL